MTEFTDPTELTRDEALVAELWHLFNKFGDYVAEHLISGQEDNGLVAAWDRLEDRISPSLRKEVGVHRVHDFVLQGYANWDEIVDEWRAENGEEDEED